MEKDLFARYSEKQKALFKKLHTENPLVYQEFSKLTKQIAKTKKKYSAEAILQVLRWHRDIETNGEPFKISNNFRSMYARLFIHNNPDYNGFFTMHEVGGEND